MADTLLRCFGCCCCCASCAALLCSAAGAALLLLRYCFGRGAGEVAGTMTGYAQIAADAAADEAELGKEGVADGKERVVIEVVGFETEGAPSGSFLGRRRVLLAVLAVLVLATGVLLLGLGCSDRTCSKYSYAQVQAALSKVLHIKDKQVQEQAEEIEELKKEVAEEAEEAEVAEEEAEVAQGEAAEAIEEAKEAEESAEAADEEAEAADQAAEVAEEKLALLASNVSGSKPAAPATPVQG